jgi:hypothetical protein
MKLQILGAAFFAAAAPMFAQQSTTNTNCMVNGQMVNCTSTTTNPTPPTGGWLSGFNKALAADRAKAEANRGQNPQNVQQSQLSPEAIKELFAEEKRERDAKDTVDFIYCRQNPKSGVTDSEGKSKACADVMEYTKAFCLVNPNDDRCTLARSKKEVNEKFAALAADFNTDPRRKKKDQQEYFDAMFEKLIRWGCMSFPDMTLPQRDGTTHSCPNAPEAGPQAK